MACISPYKLWVPCLPSELHPLDIGLRPTVTHARCVSLPFSVVLMLLLPLYCSRVPWLGPQGGPDQGTHFGRDIFVFPPMQDPKAPFRWLPSLFVSRGPEGRSRLFPVCLPLCVSCGPEGRPMLVDVILLVFFGPLTLLKLFAQRLFVFGPPEDVFRC